MEPWRTDTFLARWAAGELSDIEMKELQAHPDFDLLSRILAESGSLSVHTADFEAILGQIQLQQSSEMGTQQVDTAVHRELQSSRTRLPARRRWLIVAASAAAVALVLLIANPWQGGTSVNTTIAQHDNVVLPDGSQIALNSDSDLQFNANRFENERHVRLRGEAFFEVEKGKSFVVETRMGNIHVLGTSFNVRVRDGQLDVYCKTGKVAVESLSGERVKLDPGERATAQQSGQITRSAEVTDLSSWRAGTTRFESMPLHQVVDEVMRQYDVKIDGRNVDWSQINTGHFPHDDIDKALKMVLGPGGITYQKRSDGSFILH